MELTATSIGTTEVTHTDVQAGRVRLHVASAGPADAPPLLCVHGWPQNWLMWRLVLPALAERFRVVCPDLPGYGLSEAPANGNDPITYAADLLALLDALGIERAPVLAHDWGGFASYFLAADHPERVERLLTLNIVPPFTPARPRALLSIWRLWYQVVAASPLGPAMMRRIDRPPGPILRRLVGASVWDDGAGSAYAQQFRDRDRARSAQKLYRWSLTRLGRAVASGEFAEMHLDVPCRLLFGTRDLAQHPSLLDALEAERDDIEVVRVEGVGHFIAEQVPDRVAAEALEFLS